MIKIIAQKGIVARSDRSGLDTELLLDGQLDGCDLVADAWEGGLVADEIGAVFELRSVDGFGVYSGGGSGVGFRPLGI